MNIDWRKTVVHNSYQTKAFQEEINETKKQGSHNTSDGETK